MTGNRKRDTMGTFVQIVNQAIRQSGVIMAVRTHLLEKLCKELWRDGVAHRLLCLMLAFALFGLDCLNWVVDLFVGKGD